MTEPPPLPPGRSPPGYPGYLPPLPRVVLPTTAYTPWTTRLWAFLIDWTPIWLVVVIPMIGLVVADSSCSEFLYGPTPQYGDQGDYCTTDGSGVWLLLQFVGLLLAAIYFFWNFGYREGRTGQSIGKSLLKFKVVSEKTWRPMGFWLSVVRQVTHYLDQVICYVGYLFPLWDDKRQTLADKLMNTVCVPRDQPPPLPGPQPQPYWPT